MHFELSEEHRMIKDLVRRFVETFEEVRAAATHVEVVTAGTYIVTLDYACPADAVGTPLEFSFEGTLLKGKITEAAIATILRQAIDLGTRGDYKGQCALAAPDIAFSITDNSTQPATTISGKRRELCDAQRTSAQTLEFNSLRPSVQQTGIQIKVSADGTQATAKHTHTTTLKQHGQVVLVQTCQQEDAFGIYDGKILYNSVKSVCKQAS
mgnify:CR=1 FL=1